MVQVCQDGDGKCFLRLCAGLDASIFSIQGGTRHIKVQGYMGDVED